MFIRTDSRPYPLSTPPPQQPKERDARAHKTLSRARAREDKDLSPGPCARRAPRESDGFSAVDRAGKKGARVARRVCRVHRARAI